MGASRQLAAAALEAVLVVTEEPDSFAGEPEEPESGEADESEPAFVDAAEPSDVLDVPEGDDPLRLSLR
jgi:hypothetical protein